MQVGAHGDASPASAYRRPSGALALTIWVLCFVVTAVASVASVPGCGWTSSLLATMVRPVAVVSWVIVALLSLGLPTLLTWGMVSFVRGGVAVRALVYVLAGGGAAASLIVPVVLLGEAIRQNAPSCAFGPTPAWLVIHFLTAALLTAASVVVLALAWARRVREE